tara:strand:+ start:873 stop:1280 length:408 start_codon:yes stop_codon:yes gene_type:complete
MQTNKLIYLVPLLFLIGCNSPKQIQTIKTFDLTKIGGIYYQAYDHKWKTDPTINPAFDTKSEAYEYANMYNENNAHMYIVRMINYRYEIRITNPSNNELLYTSNDFKDAVDYVDEFKSAHDDLVLYDLKTGRQYE